MLRSNQGIRWKNMPLSVISAKVKLALRCRSRLSEKTRVLSARRGSPEKKSVSPLFRTRLSARSGSGRMVNGERGLTFSR